MAAHESVCLPVCAVDILNGLPDRLVQTGGQKHPLIQIHSKMHVFFFYLGSFPILTSFGSNLFNVCACDRVH